jgi:hypothetical protein
MSIKHLLLASLLTAATLLAGCGKAPATSAPLRSTLAAQGQNGQVGLPGNYRPGVEYPGMDGVPSLRSANFPKFTHTDTGKQSDPVNMMVAGTEQQIKDVFTRNGWVGADAPTPVAIAKLLKVALAGGSYPTSPMSVLKLYNRVQDMNWQTNQIGVRARDHLRVWKTPLRDSQGRFFWAIAATKDVAIKFGPGDKLPTHQISPDIDAEREMVVKHFYRAGVVAMRYSIQSLPENYRGKNGGDDEFFTDGKVEVLELKK